MVSQTCYCGAEMICLSVVVDAVGVTRMIVVGNVGVWEAGRGRFRARDIVDDMIMWR